MSLPRSSARALALSLLLAGCGGTADTQAGPEDGAVARAPPEASPPAADGGATIAAAPSDGSLDLSWISPRVPGGPGAAPGYAYTAKLGGHVADYPGTAAIIGPPSVPGRTITHSAEDAAPCSAAGPTARRQETLVQDALRDGVSLLLVSDGDAATTVQRWRNDVRLLTRSSVDAPPSLTALARRLGGADLLRWSAPPEPGVARVGHSLLRGLGRRPVISVPTGGLEDAALAAALVDGAVLWVGTPLERRHASLLAALRGRPGWLGREHSEIALVVPAEALRGPTAQAEALEDWLIAAAAALDGSHLPWRAALVPDGLWLPPDPQIIPRASEVALLVPPPSLLGGAHGRRLIQAVQGLQVVSTEPIADPNAARSPGFAPVLIDRVDAAALRRAIGEILARPERAGERRIAPLPPEELSAGLRVRRFWDLANDRRAYHLQGRDPGGQVLQVGGVLVRTGSRCAARAVDPWSGASRELPCGPVDGQPWLAAVTLPAVDGWTVLEVERRADSDLPAGGPPWRVNTADEVRFEGRTVGLEPPSPGPLGPLVLSMPEWLHGGGGLEETLAKAEHRRVVDPSGLAVELISEGPDVSFWARVVGRERGVDIEMRLENRGRTPWTDVRGLLCVATNQTEAAWPFPPAGQDRVRARFQGELRPLSDYRTDVGDPHYVELLHASSPVTELSSLDNRLTLAFGMDGSDVVGGNANAGICLHARPYLGDLGPGEEASTQGRLRLSPERPSELFDLQWVTAPAHPDATPFDDPWEEPCSAEGERRRLQSLPPPQEPASPEASAEVP